MNDNVLLHPEDKLVVIIRRADDGTNGGSIIVERRPGHVYCIAKAPRYASDDEWKHNADKIVSLRDDNARLTALVEEAANKLRLEGHNGKDTCWWCAWLRKAGEGK